MLQKGTTPKPQESTTSVQGSSSTANSTTLMTKGSPETEVEARENILQRNGIVSGVESANALLESIKPKPVGTTIMLGTPKDRKKKFKDEQAPMLNPEKFSYPYHSTSFALPFHHSLLPLHSQNRYATEPWDKMISNITSYAYLDHWSSIPFKPLNWRKTETKCNPLLIDPSVLKTGYSLETCSQDDPDEPLEKDNYISPVNENVKTYNVIMRVIEPDLDYPFYATFFQNKPHENYICRVGNSPVIVSIEIQDSTYQKIIYRSKEGSRRILSNKKIDSTNISEVIPELSGVKLVKVKDSSIVKDLIRYDELFQVKAYKFGLLYVGPNQHNEDDIYSNKSGSAAYDEFLHFIGDVIKLRGHKNYRGGLNVTDDETGTHSVYTTFRRFEIMFHVCTFLPFQERDTQRVERKRHIGNDVVVLVFKDRKDETDYFNPNSLTSHFNSCFFVVSPILGADGKTESYRLNIANKSGINPYYPYFPENTSVFKKDDRFKDFLLLKLINSERMAMHSGEFVVNALGARKMQLDEILKKHEKRK